MVKRLAAVCVAVAMLASVGPRWRTCAVPGNPATAATRAGHCGGTARTPDLDKIQIK
jgi:hypothetical protein